MNLDRVLNPRSIAFIGGRQAELAIEQCDMLGFDGEIWGVHPTRTSMAGRPTFRSVDELPRAPDAAFVAVNRHETVEVVTALARLEAGGAICYAAGFAEAGDEGIDLQRRLVDHNMPVIGPNCYGIINGKLGAALWPDVHGVGKQIERGAALVTQSGNIALNLTMNTRGLDFTYVLSLGNQAGVRIEDCVAHLAADPAVAVIGVHAESIIDPVAFGEAAILAHRHSTPIVMLKTGVSEVGTSIAASHTAAIAKPAAVYQALFDRYGIITVDSVNQLAATLSLLATVGPLEGASMVSLSCSGGEASLVADRAAAHGIEFARFSLEQAGRIEATLSDLVAITNPLDYHTFIWGDQEKLTACFTATLDGPANAAVLVLDWPTSGDAATWYPTLEAIAAAHRATGTPTLVAASLPENMPVPARERLNQDGIAVAHSVDEALEAVAGAAAAGRWLAGPPPLLHDAAPLHQHATETLDEADAKALLAAAGLTVPRSRRGLPEDINAVELRYPLVAKASGLAHKTDAGGVIVGIADEVGLSAAMERLATLSGEVLVEEQVTDVVAELLVTVRREHPIGTALIVGSGGTMVEVLDDTATALLPISDSELRNLLSRLKIGTVLAGHRGHPAANEAAITTTISHLAALMEARPDIVEIEINPLLATPTEAIAVDALITLGEETP
ncbi:MAG: acetate--CoA ligase family protein [bacterium]|nr:acetate--CoA ligase family protein [bacterium]